MKLSSGEKKLFVFCALLICLPLVVALFFSRINATPFVSIPPPPAAPKPNGYDLYIAAMKAMTPALPPVDSVNDGTPPPNPKARAQRYSLQRKTVWLRANQKGFALFDQALKTPSLAPPERSTRSTSFASYAKFRELARIKKIESNARWLSGDYNGALQSSLDTVQMSHDMRRGGVLLTNLVAIAVGSIGRSAAHDTVDRLNAQQARAAARRIEKLLQNRWNWPNTLTEEKYYTQSNWMDYFKEGNWRSTETFFDGAEFSLVARFRINTISKQRILDNIAATYDHDIANARLPYAKRQAPLEISNDPFFVLYGTVDSRFSDARDLAGDQSLMLRLALRACRLENGAYPPNLNALTPTYLKAIPADPFGGGQNWRYKLDGNAYRLWSIGPDGRDDGGTLVPWTKKPVTYPDERARLPFVSPDSKGDYVAGHNG